VAEGGVVIEESDAEGEGVIERRFETVVAAENLPPGSVAIDH
jgi:hypothetical protein